jgi:hypothetical protein
MVFDEQDYTYLLNEEHYELFVRFNYLSDNAESGDHQSAVILRDEIKNNCFPLEVINEVINQWVGAIPIVSDFYHIIPNYPNYKNITFEDSTLTKLKTQWPYVYYYIVERMNNNYE